MTQAEVLHMATGAERSGAVWELGRLYESMGYRRFKMSRFEEYALYLENEKFLPAGGIVTFPGKGGKLLALKPDVTLSILRSVSGERLPKRIYYNENVYRCDRSGELREIRQTGIEYVGEAGIEAMGEVTALACESLAALDGGYILDLSHMGLVTALLGESGLGAAAQEEALRLIGGKNSHELRRLMRRSGADEEKTELLCALAVFSGSFEEALAGAGRFAVCPAAGAALGELRALARVLGGVADLSHIRLDFSIVNDMSYYNGLIFRGYLPGLPEGILAGGQYDNLARRLSGAPGAIGFAVYADMLEKPGAGREYLADVLIVSNGNARAALAAAKKLRAEGRTVAVDAPEPCRETLVIQEDA